MGGFVAPLGIIQTGPLPITGNEAFAADTNLPAGVSPQTGRYTFNNLALGIGLFLSTVAGRFYNFISGLTTTTLLTVTGTLYAYPVRLPGNLPIQTLNLSVTTGQTGGAVHVGIYADNGAGYPGALLYDSGANTGPASTAVATITPAAPIALNSGIYWIATIFTATSTFPTVEAISALYTNELPADLGYDTAAHALASSGEAPSGISVAATYGTLPATFPTGATLTLNAGTPIISFGF
jgi:hypothetical protein